MDRKKFLEMCCECSKLPKGALGIPTHVPDHLIINVDDIAFYPYQYVLSYDNGEIKHYAVLHDLRANSIIQTDLTRL